MKGRKIIVRIKKIRELLLNNGIEAIIVESPINVYYLSGFTGTNATLFITQNTNYLLTDFRYVEQAEKQTTGFQIIRVDDDPYKKIKELSQGIHLIGIEDEHVTWSKYSKMREVLNEKDLAETSEILKNMRKVKDEQEIAAIREAIKITDHAFNTIIEKIKPGTAEEDIAVELEFLLRKSGASGKSFDFIIASGWRSALPHGVATEKRIAKNEFIVLDFGAIYKRYCSDLTRTVFVGEPSAKHVEIYNIVLEAQLAAIDRLKPGMSGKEVDSIARDIIKKKGYGDYFGHGLGHSVGLEIHEEPRLSPREEKIIEPGMIITVEPGIYIPNWGGVRIEDIVLVTKNGVEVLTQAQKQFIIID